MDTCKSGWPSGLRRCVKVAVCSCRRGFESHSWQMNLRFVDIIKTLSENAVETIISLYGLFNRKKEIVSQTNQHHHTRFLSSGDQYTVRKATMEKTCWLYWLLWNYMNINDAQREYKMPGLKRLFKDVRAQTLPTYNFFFKLWLQVENDKIRLKT